TRGIFAQTQNDAYFSERLLFEKPEYNGAAIAFAQFVEGRLEQRRDPRPGLFRSRFVRVRRSALIHEFHVTALPLALPPLLLQCVGGGAARRAIKPARENRLVAEISCLARKKDEHHLRYFLCQFPVADPAQRRGKDEIQ